MQKGQYSTVITKANESTHLRPNNRNNIRQLVLQTLKSVIIQPHNQVCAISHQRKSMNQIIFNVRKKLRARLMSRHKIRVSEMGESRCANLAPVWQVGADSVVANM